MKPSCSRNFYVTLLVWTQKIHICRRYISQIIIINHKEICFKILLWCNLLKTKSNFHANGYAVLIFFHKKQNLAWIFDTEGYRVSSSFSKMISIWSLYLSVLRMPLYTNAYFKMAKCVWGQVRNCCRCSLNPVQRADDSSQELGLPFNHVISKDWTQALRVGRKAIFTYWGISMVSLNFFFYETQLRNSKKKKKENQTF